MSGTTFKEAALLLAGVERFKVFPLVPNNKEPAVKAWRSAATRSLTQIAKWWQYKPWNIGVATGRGSNLVVVDLDGPDAIQWSKDTKLPRTRFVRTGKGCHLYYLYPEGDFDIRNSASKLADFVDIRGNGGYVVAPPSIHPNGSVYAWANPKTPLVPFPLALAERLHREPIPPVPEDFVPRTTEGTSPYGKAVLSNLVDEVRSCPIGARNDTLNRVSFIAGQFVAGGEIERLDAEESLTTSGLSVGLSRTEARNVVSRAMNDASAAPKRAPVKKKNAKV